MEYYLDTEMNQTHKIMNYSGNWLRKILFIKRFFKKKAKLIYNTKDHSLIDSGRVHKLLTEDGMFAFYFRW